MNDMGTQSAFALIKFFSQKEHYLSFVAGTSLFRTPHYYRICEDEGRGDPSESCISFWNRKVGGVKPKLVKPDGTEFGDKDVESILVCSAYEQYDSWMQSWAIISPHNDFESSLEQMIQEFGSFFVLLPVNKIKEYANLVEKASGLKVSYEAVRYTDVLTERSLTVKDLKFSYQKEFRFFVGQCPKGESKDKFLDLPELSSLLLDGQTLVLTSPNGVVKYCSLGHTSVVTVDPQKLDEKHA
ncbi:hypothetical protein [Vibrio vulnificus]|uniref:hypothetical protein n=1 Tax=Vibrio vulnificus TaxID=672 RepID=UPI000CD27910|nr:hypothetical protein [Vibrio vulnificus]EJN6830005.1 hypothetical protein [Vibrio cidicii]AVW98910.1 hypothetical protein BJD94_02775 [Vibrio vulnificus Env1]EGQ7936509.1 hypothetical protein [Vibrio vulnificus]EGR0637703.1 hypothetical protein [Vibrio vulnificus]EJV2652730.1 hypothetical protein [Vibrio vulnificus]